MSRGLRRHLRFYGAAVVGLAAGLASMRFGLTDANLIGVNAFWLVYLVSTAIWVRDRAGDDLREQFAEADEGGHLIVLIAIASVASSLYAIVETVMQARSPAHDLSATLRPFLALAAVPLGWATIHTVMATHYARMFYRTAQGGDQPGEGADEQAAEDREDACSGSSGEDRSGGQRDTGGLDFPGCDEPGPWEFLYYSFTLGMTAQTSDTGVTSTAMRRATLAHSVLSFFYNAVIVALAVNAGMALG